MTAVVFRVAGGVRMGLGHLRRCRTLAERLSASGATVRFVTASREAFDVIAAAGWDAAVEPDETAIETTVRTLRALAVPRVVVVDDPRLGGPAWAALGALAAVACLDDNGDRSLPVALIVNGSAGAERFVYRAGPDTRLLLGPRYIVLREAFARIPERVMAARVRRVLVLGGGADLGGVTARLVRSALASLPDVCVDAVIGPFAAPPAFDGLPPRDRERVRLHRDPPDMAALMADAELAVSGGGQTAYELAAAGTPAIGVRLAADQALNLRGLAAAGCLRDPGPPSAPWFDDRLAATLSELAGDAAARAEMGRCGRRLVDGRGAERVIDALEGLPEVLSARSASTGSRFGMASPARFGRAGWPSR